MAKLTEKAARLFLDKNFGAVATLREDGTPHVTPVWVDFDGERPVFNTAAPRAKWKRLKRDPRVTIEVHSAENPYEYVTVSGTAELDEDVEEANRHIDKLSEKYRGVTPYAGHNPGERRVIVRITPERVFHKEPG
jgi:PPOX class probable F420-dependent enzyme